jgi:hypothetical protein
MRGHVVTEHKSARDSVLCSRTHRTLPQRVRRAFGGGRRPQNLARCLPNRHCDADCVPSGRDTIGDLLYDANFEPADLNPAVFSARRLPDRVHYRMVRCGTCGLVRSDPVAHLNTLARLYEPSHGGIALYLRLGNLYLIGRRR